MRLVTLVLLAAFASVVSGDIKTGMRFPAETVTVDFINFLFAASPPHPPHTNSSKSCPEDVHSKHNSRVHNTRKHLSHKKTLFAHTETRIADSIFLLGCELDDNPLFLSLLFVLVTGLSFLFEKLTDFLEKVFVGVVPALDCVLRKPRSIITCLKC